MANISLKDALNKLFRANKKYVDENFIKKTDQYPYEPVEGDIPKVYFMGNGNFLPKTKTNVTMQMKYVSKTLTFDCWITIKCQGTSSMSYDKKNFSIRLYEDEGLTTKLKMNFKNWGPQYKYVLKANYIDLTHARNIVSAKLWGKCVKTRSNFNELPEQLRTSPNLGAIDGFFIKVYYDGMYQGRYTFNIPKDPWMTNMDTNLEQHCLLCAENYDSGCFRAPAVIDETDWTDEIHKQCPDSIKTRWNEVINFVRTSNDTDFKNNLSSYFDVESLIDYYCFQYLICGLDSLGKNQVYITYDGNLWYATSYDMDSTWGLYWDGSRTVSPAYRMPADYETGVHGTSNLLYDRLEKLFKQEIYDRYRVLREGPMELVSVISEFEQFMEVCDESIVKEDYAIFPGIPGQSFSNLRQIRDYAVDRFRYVDDCIQAFVAEEVTAGKLYELPQTTTFNGTSDYIDTGIKLFDTAKDFTLIVNGYMQNLSQAFNTPILHCMQESGEYPGLSVQNMGNSSYGVQGAPGEYFPGHNIDTNRIRFAITCRNGIVQELRMKRDKGVESYRIKSGTYNQVDKTLVIGAYKTDSGTYGRYWSGTISNFVVYNEALSGGQISNILNNMAFPRTIRSNYSPSGASFSDTINDVDFNAEELYITVDLSTCTGTNECVLSFGNNIGTWSNAYCIHLYYTKSTNTMLLDNGHIKLTQTISGTMTVIFNSDGLKVNDTLYSPTNRLTFSNISGLRTLAVGSTEGSNRSHASNYNISIRPKTTL